jgi:hypothetical protein
MFLRNVDQGEDYRDALERVNATGLASKGSFLTADVAISVIRIKFIKISGLRLWSQAFIRCGPASEASCLLAAMTRKHRMW